MRRRLGYPTNGYPSFPHGIVPFRMTGEAPSQCVSTLVTRDGPRLMPGGTRRSASGREGCLHTTLIQRLQETGSTFAFPFIVQSRRDPRKTYTLESIAGTTRATGQEP